MSCGPSARARRNNSLNRALAVCTCHSPPIFLRDFFPAVPEAAFLDFGIHPSIRTSLTSQCITNSSLGSFRARKFESNLNPVHIEQRTCWRSYARFYLADHSGLAAIRMDREFYRVPRRGLSDSSSSHFCGHRGGDSTIHRKTRHLERSAPLFHSCTLSPRRYLSLWNHEAFSTINGLTLRTCVQRTT